MDLDRNDLTSSQSTGTELRVISLSWGILSFDRILSRDIHFSSEILNVMFESESRVTGLPMYFGKDFERHQGCAIYLIFY